MGGQTLHGPIAQSLSSSQAPPPLDDAPAVVVLPTLDDAPPSPPVLDEIVVPVVDEVVPPVVDEVVPPVVDEVVPPVVDVPPTPPVLPEPDELPC
jgi:hypothetical protein